MNQGAERGMLVILSGPSGSGKTTICERLLAEGEYERSVSVTTRAPRKDESNGTDYWFTDRADFLRKAEDGYFAEYAEYCGQMYGTPREPIENAIDEGRVVFLVIEVDGAAQIREQFPDALSLFVVAPTPEEAEARLRTRRRESPDEIARRQERARYEMAQKDRFDHVIVNDDLDAATRQVREIVERERRVRQGLN